MSQNTGLASTIAAIIKPISMPYFIILSDKNSGNFDFSFLDLSTPTMSKSVPNGHIQEQKTLPNTSVRTIVPPRTTPKSTSQGPIPALPQTKIV